MCRFKVVTSPAAPSMENCQFYNGTKLIVKRNGSLDIVPFMKADGIRKVLLLTGKTAVKKLGLFDKIIAALNDAKIGHIEYDEIRANPEIKTVVKCIDLCRDNGVDAVLAVGGGSVFDSAKAVAVGAKMPKDTNADTIWDYFEGTKVPTEALPIYGVLTISASGSEHDCGAAMQDDELRKKRALFSEHCFPRVSIVDPDLQQSLPWYYQVNGFVDAMMHILEYLTVTDEIEKHEVAYEYGLSILRSIIRCGDALQKNQTDYYARANFCWAAATALDGFCGMGFETMCRAAHYLEHAIVVIDSKMSHGAGLGVAFPAFVKVNTKHGLRQRTYAKIAKDVFGKEGAEGLIEGFYEMLKRWGHPTTLDELFGKKVSEAERKELLAVFMQKPVCGFYPNEKLPEELAWETYQLM